MYNYNRDVYQAEVNRNYAMERAAQQRLPEHLRSDRMKRALLWLSANITRPGRNALSSAASKGAYHGGRYWRRTSGRAIGLVVNTVNGLAEFVPGRA